MSEEQLKALLEAVKSDAGLQEKLNAAADLDAVVEIAKDAGFMISAEELQRAQAEVSEEELEGVAGGGATLGGVQAGGCKAIKVAVSIGTPFGLGCWDMTRS